MTQARHHGRRRAEKTRESRPVGQAPARTPAHRAPAAKASGAAITVKGVAAVAVAGTLMAAGGVAQHVGSDANHSAAVPALASEVQAWEPVSVPSNAAIDFAQPNVSSSVSASPEAAPLAAKAGSVTAVNDPAAAKAFAASELPSFGWGADQMQCLSLLWQRESEWLTAAENASSGAYGIAQSLPAEKMASTGSDWATNYETQIRWGLGYIAERYGSPCGAWGHSESVGWY